MTSRDTTEHRMSRRWFALGVAGATMLGATQARAQTHSRDHAAPAAAGKKKPVPKTVAAPAKYKAVIDAAKVCESKGQVCRAHCIRLIRRGDTSLEECLKLVNVMLPVSAATSKLAAQDAKRFKELAKVCLDVCTDCEAECKKHAPHHAECKGCMEACQGMITALKAALA